nr:glycoside hydrolase family 3 C-terminal domain-containing protein [Actinocorallia herbida]
MGRPAPSGDQEDLIAAVVATGAPTAVIVVSGRPLLLDRICRGAGAVIWAPLLGPAAGLALADVIVGNTAPAGRLPVSFPASIGQIPVFHGSCVGSGYDTPGGEDDYGYIDGSARPLFPFGHGLGYAQFAYGDLESAASEVQPGSWFNVTVEIRNTGDREADEVVQPR